MTRKTFIVPAEQPWQADTILVADRCWQCKEAEPEVVWNRRYPVCRACVTRWIEGIKRAGEEGRAKAALVANPPADLKIVPRLEEEPHEKD